MIGGEKEIVHHLDPIFAALAPGIDAAPRTPGRHDRRMARPSKATLHWGRYGAGHFVKMVHNGIEYGLMAAYAEGLNILHSANAGKRVQTRMRRQHRCATRNFTNMSWILPEIAEVWRRGSVVASWLLDLTAEALIEDAELAGILRTRFGFRRRTLDNAGGGRRRCACTSDQRGALQPFRVPGECRLC